MIPVLFDQNEINLPEDIRFKSNGLGVLKDTISCYVEEERNEEYESEIIYPVEGFLYDKIKGNRWIKIKSNDRYNDQIFRIYYISEPINGTITVKLEHISYILKDNFVEKIKCTGNCQTSLNALNTNAAFSTKFNFFSDISMSALFFHEREKLWDCIKGIDGSIVDIYGNGADIIRDNFNLSVVKNGGQDNNILISYTKNMTGFTCEEDWTGCITKIYPFAIRDDIIYTIQEKYIDSEYIQRDSTPRIEKIDFSSNFADDEEITEEALRAMAHNYFINNACDIPKLNYKVEFVQLSTTEEFKNIIDKENIALFDNVIIRHEVYNIDTKIKILKTKYDTLLEKYETIELNYTKPRMSKNIIQTVKKQKKELEDTKEELTSDIDDAKEEAAQATSNLKIVMEKRDSEIELSVANEAEKRKTSFEVMDGKIEQKVDTEEFDSYKEQTDREISQGVKKDELGSELLEHFDEIVQVINDGTEHKATFNSSGFHIKNGGLTIENNNGDIVLECDTHGNLKLNHVYADDLSLNEESSKVCSSFWNVLNKMDSITLTGELKMYDRLVVESYDGIYIKDAGQNLKEFIKSVVKNMQ